jgi:hypothetical protein
MSQIEDDPFVETSLNSESSRFIRTPLGFVLKPTAAEFKPKLRRKSKPLDRDFKTKYGTPTAGDHDPNPGFDLNGYQLGPEPPSSPPSPKKAVISIMMAFSIWQMADKCSLNPSEFFSPEATWRKSKVEIVDATEEEWDLFSEFAIREWRNGKEWTKYILWKR